MLARRGGHIVNISSMGAASVFPGLAVYSATKAGLSHFTAGLRADFRGRPIGTTLVELGATATDMLVGVKSYPPTLAAFDRAYGWHVFVDTPPERVAEATVAAVLKGRRYVRLPTRAALFPVIAELPRKLTEILLKGSGAEIR
jgi:short-subunit dehydrogenase